MNRRVLCALLFSAAGCAGSATVVATTTPAPGPVVAAPAPAAHPAYLHALSDLREARAYLQRPANVVVKWDENVAIREIDAAIHEIKAAAIDDGKPLEDHPAVDVGMEWGGRLHRALELVRKAHADVNQEEDNAYANGLKNRAIQHIDASEHFIGEGIADAGAMQPTVVVQQPPPPQPEVVVQEGAHPAYLHALSDLRLARAELERPARPDVKWDENAAIREIDAAIREIKGASIDDGKPLQDHPAVDTHFSHRDRLRAAMELLHKSAKDIDEREDNGWAKGLRGRANGHIRAAENAVRAAIGERADEAPPPPPPPAEGAHPAYLHALSDMRLARAELERPARPDVKWDENAAIREIDAAIREIKGASIDDGKPLQDHPPIDTHFSHRDRLRAAMELLHKSAQDIEEHEDNGWAKGLRNRANQHIRAAEAAVRAAIGDRAEDNTQAPPPPAGGGDHPAYLHALSDMRLARAELEKPAHADVKWDENVAIREVDAAINEIKHASIDDGKPLEDHPPVDTHFNHRDRLRAAMKLLHKAAKDIEQREDNGWAQGLRGRAVGHIRGAEHAIGEAIHERDDE